MTAIAMMNDLFDSYFDGRNTPINDIETEFRKFHKNNPQVYNAIEHLALKEIANGRERYGMKAIFERLRWESDVLRVKGIDNSFTSHYARLFQQQNPKHADFFETRPLRGLFG